VAPSAREEMKAEFMWIYVYIMYIHSERDKERLPMEVIE
jgi:hypothetical protein